MDVMRWLIAVVGALALATGASAALEKEPPQLYGLLERAGRDDLVRIDRESLRPVGDRLDVGEFGHGWVFSKDRSQLALGVSYIGARGRTPAVRIVDLRGWRGERLITLPGQFGSVRAASWVGNRVLALVDNPRAWDLVAVDPDGGKVVGRRTLIGHVLHAVPTVRGLTLLTAPQGALGPAAVVLVDRDLRSRSVTLDRISAGSEMREDVNGVPVPGPSRHPGFVLRSGALGAVAWVLGASAPPATVDLNGLTVRYAANRTLAVAAKTREASWRFGHWAGGHEVVYGGMEYTAEGKATRVGVSLLDARTWEQRPLDATATAAVAGGGSVVTWDSRPAADRTLGLRVFGSDGSLRFTVLPRAAVGTVQIVGARALVRLFGTRPVAKVLDLRMGAVVTTIRGNVPHPLAGAAASW
jgi:hypothetical protein